MTGQAGKHGRRGTTRNKPSGATSQQMMRKRSVVAVVEQRMEELPENDRVRLLVQDA